MKFKGSAKFEWQEDSYGCLDLTIAGVLIGWISYKPVGYELNYDMWDREGEYPLQTYKTLDEAKVALLNHFGIEASQEEV